MAMGRARQKRRQRGLTLVELLVALGVVAMMATIAVMGLGVVPRARLRESAAMIAGAIRVAYTHANATSRPTRLVFDFEARTITLEESPGRMLLEYGDRTGGAQAATDAERAAVEAAERIVEGTVTERPSYQPVKTLGFDPEKGSAKSLADGIRFRQIEVEHEDGPVTTERAYLYFWPGGQTEYASIQLQVGEDAEPDEALSVMVMTPLTGRTAIEHGAREMLRPRSDEEASERSE